MKEFLQYAAKEVTFMKDNMEQLKKTQEDLSEFFCEDPKTFRMEECYKSLGKKHALKNMTSFRSKY